MFRSDYKTLDTRLNWLQEQLELERKERDHALSLAKELAGRPVEPAEPIKKDTP